MTVERKVLRVFISASDSRLLASFVEQMLVSEMVSSLDFLHEKMGLTTACIVAVAEAQTLAVVG